MQMVHKLWNDKTLEILIEQGSKPKFIGPFSKEMYDEWKVKSNTLVPGCGCTSYSIDRETEQITFTVEAPSFPNPLPQPYMKAVNPKFTSKENNDIVVWEIKFNVKQTK